MNEEKGIPTEVVPPVVVPAPGSAGNEPVSSSRIRAAISSGDLALAAALMGRNVELDLGDLRPTGVKGEVFVYDLRSAHRIVPAAGQYPVLMYPGARRGRAEIDNGKVLLTADAESLEFLTD